MDKRIEQIIFKAMSDDGTGPKLLHQAKGYRIEEFLAVVVTLMH